MEPRDQTVFRAHFSALTKRDIVQAFKDLGIPDYNQSRSVDARQELDLRIGCAFTRFQTKFFQGKYGQGNFSLISYGPCQTPTLGFCVERHDIIQTFKPEPYWVVQVSVKGQDQEESNGDPIPNVTLSWNRVRLFDRDIAVALMNQIKGIEEAKVISVTTKEKSKARPAALNTVELLRAASSGLGLSPHHAMQIAERLYTQGYISYPRTETTSYPDNFDLKGTLAQHVSHPDWGNHAKGLMAEGISRPKKGTDVGDHPPITPMRCATRSDFNDDSAWRLYDFICRYFIGTISPDCTFLSRVVDIAIGDERFTVSGKNLLKPGFTSVMTWLALSSEEQLPPYKKGEVLQVSDVSLVERETSPPDYLTEAELISLMEKHGIGTDASIPVHINNICERNYVEVRPPGRSLVPLTLGIVLVHGYQKIDPELVLPTMRSAVEAQLNLIAHGEANFDRVLQHTLSIFRLKFQYFVMNIEPMDNLFEVSFSTLADSGRPLSKCGKCRRFMKLVQARPIRLHCVHCDETYSLPQNGTIKVYKDLQCPLDDFTLLSFGLGKKGKTFVFCPYCYNYPPFEDMRRFTGCNACSHPTCPHGLAMNGVCACIECERGAMVLDSTAPPKWRLICNKCDVILQIFEGAHNVSVLEEECPDCNVCLVSVKYKEGKSKFEDESLEAKGCIFCSPLLSPLIEKHRALNQKIRPQTAPGGATGAATRGGPGGKRGRGKGKRPKPPKDKMAQLAAYFV
ncbi:unnamed protein product [Cyprideis torosa]|uniref:DNA topoisomerase n=1 Tax=Cyprideis torosa TaxID=163714 RepID=A0A7R8WDC8_9CRUS|nr:unnamed protein product [Cyprideis torosa]CAG0894470.1 unnamed protein product [Cyprideis torosa]